MILDFLRFSIRQNREDRLRFGWRLRKKPRKNQSINNNRARANGCLRRYLADAKPRRTIRSTLTWTNIEPKAGFVCRLVNRKLHSNFYCIFVLYNVNIYFFVTFYVNAIFRTSLNKISSFRYILVRLSSLCNVFFC